MDFDELHDVIAWCINFRSKDLEKSSAGYSVYEVNKSGGFGRTLLNVQHDGLNSYGVLVDPDRPDWFFNADPHAVLPFVLTPAQFAALYCEN